MSVTTLKCPNCGMTDSVNLMCANHHVWTGTNVPKMQSPTRNLHDSPLRRIHDSDPQSAGSDDLPEVSRIDESTARARLSQIEERLRDRERLADLLSEAYEDTGLLVPGDKLFLSMADRLRVHLMGEE